MLRDRTILPPHEPASERGCVEDQPQRVATFVAAAAGAPLPRTQPRSVCQSVQGFNARSFPWANSHPGPLPLGSRWERENCLPMVGQV